MQDNQSNEPKKSSEKEISTLDKTERTLKWTVLGLLAPPIGLAFYFQMKKARPRTAEAVLLGTLIGFGIVFIALFILGIFLGAQAA